MIPAAEDAQDFRACNGAGSGSHAACRAAGAASHHHQTAHNEAGCGQIAAVVADIESRRACRDAVEKANPEVFPQRFRGMGRGNGKDGQGASRQQNPRGDHHQFEIRGPLHVQAAVFGKKAVCQARIDFLVNAESQAAAYDQRHDDRLPAVAQADARLHQIHRES